MTPEPRQLANHRRPHSASLTREQQAAAVPHMAFDGQHEIAIAQARGLAVEAVLRTRAGHATPSFSVAPPTMPPIRRNSLTWQARDHSGDPLRSPPISVPASGVDR